MTSEIERSQIKLYSSKFKKFGDTPKSLSWNDRKTQSLRFQRISELFKYEGGKAFTIHEVGCGLAHFKEFLENAGYNCIYSGSDVVTEFVESSRQKYPQCSFYVQSISLDYEHINDAVKGKDYYCVSGTFYTKEDNSVEAWEAFVFKAIRNMYRMAKKGIAFNFLTSHSDFYDKKLYYANPGNIIDWCVKNLSRFVLLLHDAPLYEFTVVVYKEEFVKSKFPGYDKYFK